MSERSRSLPPHYRRNFTAFLVDYVFFGIGLTFADPTSVLPAFSSQLTDSAPLVGLTGTIFNGAWLLPQLVAARLIGHKPRKKPYLLGAVSGRIALLVIPLALWAGLSNRPTAMLVLFLTCLGLWAASDGVASVAWFDMLARAIPAKQRSRLIGGAQFISRSAGIGAGALVALILNRRTFPDNYTLIFALACLTLTPSAIALMLIREPPPGDTDPDANAAGGTTWLKPIINDPAFRRLMACRLLVGMLSLASSFYVLHARDVLHLPQSIIGGFVAAQTLGGMISSLVLGLVSERWGPRYVARIGSAAAAAGPFFALLVHLADGGWLAQAYPLIYVTMGIVNSAWMLGFYNYLLEIAPEGMCAAYVGLGNTIMGVLTLLPVIGGWLLESTSYTTLFSVTGVTVTAGFLLTLGLKPPRPVTPAEDQP